MNQEARYNALCVFSALIVLLVAFNIAELSNSLLVNALAVVLIGLAWGIFGLRKKSQK